MRQTHKLLPSSTVIVVAAACFAWWAEGAAALAKDQADRPEVGDEAADFELEALDGDKVKLSKLVEQGPVVLIVLRGFPGYQCPLCNTQVGQFLSGAEKFEAAKTRVVFVYPGPADDLKKRAEEFVSGKSLPETIDLLVDPDYELTNSYHLRWNAPMETAYPATFVIDANRKIQFANISTNHAGRTTAKEVLEVLNRK